MSLSIVAACLLIAEGCLTLAFSHSRPGVIGSGTFFIYRKNYDPLRFDSIRGVFLPKSGTQVARVTLGTLEYHAIEKGNAQGFPDRDDFSKSKPKGVRRFFVCGDSFTAGDMLATNWPDRVEQSRHDLQLYNIATNGGGLANWWSNLTRFVIRDGYEFDGVIFAVFPGDLGRSFTIKSHERTDRPLFARVGWEPDKWPKTDSEARAFLRPIAGNYSAAILEPDDFDRAVQTKRLGGVPPQPIKPWIASTLLDAFHRKPQPREPLSSIRPTEDPVGQSQIRMISDLGKALVGKRIIVVHIAKREEAIAHSAKVDDSLKFSRMLGATFFDGCEIFDGLSTAEVRALFLPYDGHWNQVGSDRFATWIERRLQ